MATMHEDSTWSTIREKAVAAGMPEEYDNAEMQTWLAANLARSATPTAPPTPVSADPISKLEAQQQRMEVTRDCLLQFHKQLTEELAEFNRMSGPECYRTDDGHTVDGIRGYIRQVLHLDPNIFDLGQLGELGYASTPADYRAGQ